MRTGRDFRKYEKKCDQKEDESEERLAPVGNTIVHMESKAAQRFLNTIVDVHRLRIVLCCPSAVSRFKDWYEACCEVYAFSWLPASPTPMPGCTEEVQWAVRPFPVLYVQAEKLAELYRSVVNPRTISAGKPVRMPGFMAFRIKHRG